MNACDEKCCSRFLSRGRVRCRPPQILVQSTLRAGDCRVVADEPTHQDVDLRSQSAKPRYAAKAFERLITRAVSKSW
jgi:hypothetical protein